MLMYRSAEDNGTIKMSTVMYIHVRCDKIAKMYKDVDDDVQKDVQDDKSDGM